MRPLDFSQDTKKPSGADRGAGADPYLSPGCERRGRKAAAEATVRRESAPATTCLTGSF